ncbi:MULTISPECIES: hypothetical protein [unclassified Pseudoclavibacter]|uniref:hypothetical protein n=1 Tax=unclassified Pseudoclavibacter TaxID=2615177 RepID=UPI001BA87969|nr:hypothetical protein [Pseudoclavibacter sp. Marseille-Q4354]MBS3179180.1 hypothetical protein [Pseudoclavibacter sp. Marseille-Q4354]
MAISRIESGKTDPAGSHRRRLLETLGHTEKELTEAVSRVLEAQSNRGGVFRVLAGPLYAANEVRQSHIVADSNRLTREVAFELERFREASSDAQERFIEPFLESVAQVDVSQLLEGRLDHPPSVAVESVEVQVKQLRRQTQFSLLRAVAESAGGALAGFGVGMGTAAGTLATVSATASASTGTAIASLSGAAASRATLAWLGGGSLAAGGMGISGGTAVVSGIVALPVLLAAGTTLVWRGRELRRESEAEAVRLDAAKQALDAMRELLPRSISWNQAQQETIRRAERVGHAIQLQKTAPFMQRNALNGSNETQADWKDLPLGMRQAVSVQFDLVDIILQAQALPVWLEVMAINQPDRNAEQDRTAAKSEEWINTSLKVFAAELDEHEAWAEANMN